MVKQYVGIELLYIQKHAADLYKFYCGHGAVCHYMISGLYSQSVQFYLWAGEVTRQQDVFLGHHVHIKLRDKKAS